MSCKLVTTKKAEEDLENIAEYISEDNPKRAISFVQEIKNYLTERLSNHPLSAKIVNGQIMMLPYKRYVVLYVVDEKEKIVWVLNVFAGGQDWENNI